jgi:hypothetical protein
MMASLGKSSNLPPAGGSEALSRADRHVWEHLKHAIASSSGFQRWQEEQIQEEQVRDDLERKVCSYLRETLETLAY